MARPAMNFATILFAVIISELFVLQTNATFFIELIDGMSPGVLRLFECPLPASANQEISCTAVVDGSTKSRIYSTANFYWTTFPRLNGNQRIIVGNSVLSRNAHHNIFLGVTLIGGEAHTPDFLKDDKNIATFQARMITRFMTNVNQDSVVTFMTFTNFHIFARPTRETTNCFKQYGKVMENLKQVFAANALSRASRMGSTVGRPEPDESRMDDTIQAIHFLLKKMIDPCFTQRQDSTLANALCDKQCKFLAIGFAVYPTAHTSDCNRAIGFGSCSDTVCTCAVRVELFNCQCGLTHSAMIKCSNTLRTGIAPPL